MIQQTIDCKSALFVHQIGWKTLNRLTYTLINEHNLQAALQVLLVLFLRTYHSHVIQPIYWMVRDHAD